MATGTPRGTELRKLFPVGKELEVKIIEMDPRRGEIKLSIKALAEETDAIATLVATQIRTAPHVA